MKIFIKHILRNLKDNKKRTFLMMLSLFFTGVFVSMILSGYIFIAKAITEISKSLDSNYDFIVTSRDEDNPITKEQLDDLFHGNAYYHFDVNEDGNVNNKSAGLMAIDLESAQKFGYLVPKNKKQNYVLEKNETIIPKDLAKSLNIKEGDSFKFINSEGFEFELKAKYIVNKDKLFTISQPIVISIDDFKDLMGIEELNIYSYQVLMNKKISDEEYQKIKEEANIINLEITTYAEMAKEVNIFDALGDTTDQLVVVFGLISVVLLVIIYFINNSLVKIILNERIPVIGTFRSLGASRKKMNWILVLEMAIYGLFAGIPSSIIGFLIIKKGSSFVMSGGSDTGNSLDISAVFNNNAILIISVSIITIVLIQLLLSLKEIIKCNKISIKDSIFSKYDNLFVYNYKDLIIGLTMFIIGIIVLILHEKVSVVFGFIGIFSLIISFTELVPFITKFILEHINIKKMNLYKLARQNAIYGKLQISNNLLLGVLLIVVMLLIFSANSAIKSYNARKDNYSFDIVLEEYSLSKLQEDKIKSIDEVEDLYVLNLADTTSSTLYNSKYYLANVKFKTLDFYNSKDFEKIVEVDGDFADTILDPSLASKLKDNEVMLDKSFMKKNDLNVGDYINFVTTISSNNLKEEMPIYLKIVGSHEEGEKVLIISDDLKKELESLFAFNNMSYVITKEGSNNDEVKKKIMEILYTEKELKEIEDDSANSELAYSLPKTNKEYLDDNLKEAKKGLRINIYICLGITIVMSICLLNNQKVSFIQRKKEFATLYSLCMSRTQLKSLIIKEFLISYVITAIISIGYVFLLKYLIESTIHVGEIVLDFSVSIIYMVAILISILLIILLMSRKIIKEVDKLNIVEEIKYE